ncbi:putative alcohol dehydrogenase [Halenospora varia]|nr:putative alcohol dehydrogenase [Halenospora varia]
MTDVDQNIAAVLESTGARLKTTNRQIPTPSPDELVLQDYGFFIEKYHITLGSDVCGIVTDTGSAVTKFKNSNIDHGAFQTYTVLRELATTIIPDKMSFEYGCVFPMGMATATIAIFVKMGIPRPTSHISPQNSGFLVWGASSSAGMSAVQLARNLGFKVFVTASLAHYDYLRSLGAFEVFGYHDSDVVDKIVVSAIIAGTPIKFGFDSIPEANAPKQCANVHAVGGGNNAKLVLTLPWLENEEKPKKIEILQTEAFETGTSQSEFGAWFFNVYLQDALEDKSVVSAPKAEIVEGGIESAQNAWDMSKAGVSGKKIVVTVK